MQNYELSVINKTVADQRLDQLFEFLKLSPSDSFTLYSIGYEYMQMQDWENAYQYFEKLAKNDPGYIGTYYHLGKTLQQLNRFDDAIKAFQQGMQQARKKKDMHAYGELQRALNSALGLDYEDEV